MAPAREDPKTMSVQHVPTYIVGGAVILIPVAVACVNYVMVLVDMYLIDMKFSLTQEMMSSSGVGPGTALLLGYATALALLATLLVSLLAPICAGSGIPEVLGFLNGNYMPDLFNIRGFFVRVIAIVFVQVAGFPVGREGPMVAIGGTVGYGVAWLLLRQQERRSEAVVALPEGGAGNFKLSSSVLVVNEERFAFFRRVGCALGGAAGIATAFNAPIGGMLYMFEELAVSSLPPDLARFMCTVFASLMARALLQATQLDVHRLVIYGEDATATNGSWDWADIPLIVALSAVLGCVGALFSKSLLATWSFRRKMAARLSRYQPWAKIIECTLYCAICSLAWGLVPAMFECKSVDAATEAAENEEHHRLLAGSSHLDYVQYACPDGEYNEVASYFLNGAEGAIKHLYSQSGGQRSGPLAVALVFYFTLACGMPGLAVPMGTFVPSMLSGALAGRLFGENLGLLMASLHGPTLAHAGIYAVVGSAAMLAGLTHMTAGIVALLAEAIGNFGIIVPLMLSVFVAQMVSKLISEFGYDEHLIIMKGIPFLDPEIPREMETEGLTAADIIDALPDEALLPHKVTIQILKRALKQHHINYFPVIAEGSICVGLTTRGRLLSVLRAVSKNNQPQARVQRSPSVDSANTSASNGSDANSDLKGAGPSRSSLGHLVDPQAEANIRGVIKTLFTPPNRDVEDGDSAKDTQDVLPLDRIMDSAPLMLDEDMPVPRFYNLFNKTGSNVAVVVSKRGRFRGILTRGGLIKAQAKLHSESHKIGGQSSSLSRDRLQEQADQHPAFRHDFSETSEQHDLGETSEQASRAGPSSATDRVVAAVSTKMRLEELEAELHLAYKRMNLYNRSKDELKALLEASEQRYRELQRSGLRSPEGADESDRGASKQSNVHSV